MMKDLLNLFYPAICLGCDTILLFNEKTLCTHCRHELPLTNHHLNSENEAFKRIAGRIPAEYISSMLYFHKQGIVQNIIHQLKYQGNQEIGSLLGKWYALIIKDYIPKTDYIIPVPLHRRKLKERGYNQVTTFSEAISKELSIPIISDLLVRNRYTKTQTKKSFFNRTEISKNLFGINYSEEYCNKHFLLIDDVLTTGTTLELCSKALLNLPNTKISIITMAYTA